MPRTKTPSEKPAPKRPAAKSQARAKKTPSRTAAARKTKKVEPAAPERESLLPAVAAYETPSPAAVPISAPVPGTRRAIFIDVENTSSESALVQALDHLGIDRTAQQTELVAVGNWRVIGHQVGRMLAARGARLLHSAPATGVRDWSDLAIAVNAGIWLGRSRPGDVIDIVSGDRAFDAVADAATTLGVVFRRLSYKSGSSRAAAAEEPRETGPSGNGRRRRRRGGSGRRYSDERPNEVREPREPVRASAPPPPREPARETEPAEDDDRHGATHQQIVAAIARLTARDPERGVNLDLLINALKSEGFSRPPNSPRLVTRLRMMKDVQVSSSGMVRLAGAAAPGRPHASEEAVEPEPESAPEPVAEPEVVEEPSAATGDGEAAAPKKASRRRGSRGGRRTKTPKAAAASAAAEGGAAE